MAFRMTGTTLARRGAPKLPPGAPKENMEDLRAKYPLLVEALRPLKPPPPLPEEEHRRLRELMVRYGKLKRKQFLDVEIRMNAAKRAMWVAVDALPHERRVEAVFTRAPKYPEDLRVPTHTPPIKGFSLANLAKQTKK